MPGRYREDDIPDLPGTARFVHPTVPYNPNLPPAAFPTLDEPRPVGATTARSMNTSLSNSDEQSQLQRRATVFHDRRRVSDVSLPEESSALESEEPMPERQNVNLAPKLLPVDEDPGEFESYGSFAYDDGVETRPRAGLPVSLSDVQGPVLNMTSSRECKCYYFSGISD
jgi:hypothetical protein